MIQPVDHRRRIERLEAEMTRLPAKLMPLVEEYKGKVAKLTADMGGKLVFEKG